LIRLQLRNCVHEEMKTSCNGAKVFPKFYEEAVDCHGRALTNCKKPFQYAH